MLDMVVPATLKDIRETNDIAINIGIGVLKRVPYASLGSKIYNKFELAFMKQVGHHLAVCHVDLPEREVSVMFKLGKSRFLQAYVVVIVKVVNADKPIAALRHCLCQMIADKSGGAGD